MSRPIDTRKGNRPFPTYYASISDYNDRLKLTELNLPPLSVCSRVREHRPPSAVFKVEELSSLNQAHCTRNIIYSDLCLSPKNGKNTQKSQQNYQSSNMIYQLAALLLFPLTLSSPTGTNNFNNVVDNDMYDNRMVVSTMGITTW